MKKRFYIKSAFLSLTVAALFSSCLKDNTRYVNFAGSPPLVELPAATGVGPTGGLFQALALNIQSTPVILNVQVNVAAAKPLSSALTVNLSVDQTALNNYNTANGTSYMLLPAADYTSSLSATIPANQNSANVVVNINSSLIDPSNTNYVLPLTITNAGGQQISNYKTVLYNVQVKNKYDGNYHATGVRHHPTLGDFPFDYNVDMGTAGATAIDGGGFADSKADLKITVNADNTVTLSSTYQVVMPQAGLPNNYNPTTRTFTLNYFYNTSAPRLISETLVHN